MENFAASSHTSGRVCPLLTVRFWGTIIAIICRNEEDGNGTETAAGGACTSCGDCIQQDGCRTHPSPDQGHRLCAGDCGDGDRGRGHALHIGNRRNSARSRYSRGEQRYISLNDLEK